VGGGDGGVDHRSAGFGFVISEIPKNQFSLRLTIVMLFKVSVFRVLLYISYILRRSFYCV